MPYLFSLILSGVVVSWLVNRKYSMKYPGGAPVFEKPVTKTGTSLAKPVTKKPSKQRTIVIPSQ